MATELTLSGDYVVRVRSVPPYVGQQMFYRSQQALPPEPERPRVEAKSVAGHVEEMPAPEDSPEWQAWQEARRLWYAECARVTEEQNLRNADFTLDYAVVEWRPPVSRWRRLSWLMARLAGLDPGWRSEPPKGWTLPAVLGRHGLGEESDNLRLDFIRCVLVATVEDMERLTDVAVGRVAPLREEEVDAAFAGFPAEDGEGRRGIKAEDG